MSQTKTIALSTEAADALIGVATNRQGATISDRTPARVVDELFGAGLIGVGNGLTRRGTIERERLMSAQLDALFG